MSGEFTYSEVSYILAKLKHAKHDLQAHKAALEKARVWFYNIDVAIDDTCGSDLKQMCRDALSEINTLVPIKTP